MMMLVYPWGWPFYQLGTCRLSVCLRSRHLQNGAVTLNPVYTVNSTRKERGNERPYSLIPTYYERSKLMGGRRGA